MSPETTTTTETETLNPLVQTAPEAEAAVQAAIPAVAEPSLPEGILSATAVAGDYLPILIFLCIAGGMACVMTLLPLIFKQKPDVEKLSTYECGFDAHGDTRTQFDVRFYLVAILFIIFDLEVAFLFPWAAAFGDIGVFGFWSMMLFLGLLTVGFIYEWKKGALDWE